MRIFDLESFVTLVLLKEVEKFRDSYSLTKVLSWKFDIISVSEVVDKLQSEKLITSSIKNGISTYEVTNAGLEYIGDNMEEGKKLLLQKYKGEQNFIESLFA